MLESKLFEKERLKCLEQDRREGLELKEARFEKGKLEEKEKQHH